MSNYLATPPESPIDIDAAVNYKYVVAQQGASAITVDSDANFTFSVAFGSPAVVTIKYTGTIPTAAAFHTVNINVRWQDGSATTVHSVSLRVLGQPPATRQIPAILNPGGVHVGPSEQLRINITADIDADSYGELNLPGGLALNTSTGAIVGTAPSVNGFYVVTFVANVGINHHKRYFVIVVGDGGIGAGGGALDPITPQLKIFLDGDFTQAQIAGPVEYEIPFKTDPTPYIYKMKYWQLFANYSRPAFGTAGPFGGFYVGETSGSTRAIGGGVMEFERRYALVPNSRNEWESFVYGLHFQFYTLGFPNTCIEATPVTLNSRVQYDYFHTDDPNSIELPRAPGFMNTCLGLYAVNGALSFLLPTPGSAPVELQAEDAQLRIWELNIYERKMRFVKPPTTLELIS